jgi:diguanylate cyclase (GGDEF)-like protein/putative nucleotidyltransferase with HDIG domain
MIIKNRLETLKEKLIISRGKDKKACSKDKILDCLKPVIDDEAGRQAVIEAKNLFTFEAGSGSKDRKTYLVKQIDIPDSMDKPGSLISCTDISDMIKVEQRLKKRINKLQKASLVDNLTRLNNRTCFYQNLSRELNRCRRYGQNLSMLMIDIDLFKIINDDYGHLFGDFVLCEIAQILRKNCRESDFVFRYGGDEFIILLPNTYYDGALMCADKIRAIVKKRTFCRRSGSVKTTLSIGISSLSTDLPEDEASFIEFADQALLKVKKMGGDSILCYRDLKINKDLRDHSPRDLGAEKENNFIQPIATLLKALEIRDSYSKRHSLNVMDYAVRIAARMGLDHSQTRKIKDAAIIHDIGKIGISDRILLKKGGLSDEERSHIQMHPLLGVRMLRHINELNDLKTIVLRHHEWFNGDGYPDHLKGNEIPLEARIIAVADAYDAMTSVRPYRDMLSKNQIKAEFKKYSGVQFCPEVLEYFLTIVEEVSPMGKDLMVSSIPACLARN